MKKMIICLAVLAMLLSVCGLAMAQDTLVTYSARNERLNNIVIPAFEEATGIKVEVVTGSTGEINQRVKAEVESGNVTGDINVDGIELVSAACQTVYLDAFDIRVNSNGVTAMNEISGNLRIYADGHDIIVESPVSQRVVISDVAGRSYSVDVTAGRNVIPARLSGVVIVAAGEKTVKLMLN